MTFFSYLVDNCSGLEGAMKNEILTSINDISI